MKVAQLFSMYPQLRWGKAAHQELKGISQNSRSIKAGDVYVAVRGHAVDGHQFLPQAIANGAVGLVVEDASLVPDQYEGAVVQVSDSRLALARLAARFYSNPADSLFCVGVTGTNGKTTVSYMAEQVLSAFNWKVGVLGTIDHHLGDKRWSSQLTTPDPLTLQKRLQEFLALGAQSAVFEVSSIAIDQFRVETLPFDVLVFTNFSRDHLDYHKDMRSYYSAKERLFRELPLYYNNKRVAAVINTDDPGGRGLQVANKVRTLTYGVEKADIRFRMEDFGLWGSQVALETPFGKGEFRLPVPGRHNVYNACAAIGCGLAAGLSLSSCCEAISEFHGVPGRMQRVDNDQGLHVFVDYAHTHDALNSVLGVLREMRDQDHKRGRLITVFGCGGDRDPGKRPLMGRVAEENSDIVIVTSDNPRKESPDAIVEDILSGIKGTNKSEDLIVEVDRSKAIQRAVELARKNDIVLIAGKGHEDYQVLGDETIAFSDRDEAYMALKNRVKDKTR